MVERDILQHVFQSLRNGVVPERGCETYAEGLEAERVEIERLLELARHEGVVKFLRGGFGSGKTLLSHMATYWALERNFATAKVVVSINDTQFHKFDQVYQKITTSLRSKVVRQGLLPNILDRWITRIEDQLESLGEDPDAPDFDTKVHDRLTNELRGLSEQASGTELVQVVAAYFDAKQQGDFPTAHALANWLGGSSNVAASIKRAARIKGDVSSATAMHYLRVLVSLMRQVGFAGLLVVVDEMETVMRMRSNVREQTLNAVRQIVDDNKVPGLFWLFTGTPAFYDNRNGVAGLEPLHQRIQFQAPKPGLRNLMQPQMELQPFGFERLVKVARTLRSLRADLDGRPYDEALPDECLQRIARDMTEGFKADVGVVPRQFLRHIVTELDVAEQNPGYRASGYAEINESWLSEEELAMLGKSPLADGEGELPALVDL